MTPVVRYLLVANVAVFFLQMTAPAIANAGVFVPMYVLVRPWSIVTYMFLHGDLMHLGLNMLGLFFFGPRVEDRLSSKRFTLLYFLSGFAGALFSIVFAPTSPIIGASAGVFGVMLGFAYFWPTTPIMIWGIFPVPARVLVIVTTVLAVWSGFSGAGGNIAHFAHLGGYAGAYAYLRWLDRARSAFKRKSAAAPAAVTHRLEGWSAIDLNKVHEVNREEVRRLLEKVRTQGVGALSGQERVFLSGFVPPDDSSAARSR
jgi:membrane associated rhomboid family serine protease